MPLAPFYTTSRTLAQSRSPILLKPTRWRRGRFGVQVPSWEYDTPWPWHTYRVPVPIDDDVVLNRHGSQILRIDMIGLSSNDGSGILMCVKGHIRSSIRCHSGGIR